MSEYIYSPPFNTTVSVKLSSSTTYVTFPWWILNKDALTVRIDGQPVSRNDYTIPDSHIQNLNGGRIYFNISLSGKSICVVTVNHPILNVFTFNPNSPISSDTLNMLSNYFVQLFLESYYIHSNSVPADVKTALKRCVQIHPTDTTPPTPTILPTYNKRTGADKSSTDVITTIAGFNASGDFIAIDPDKIGSGSTIVVPDTSIFNWYEWFGAGVLPKDKRRFLFREIFAGADYTSLPDIADLTIGHELQISVDYDSPTTLKVYPFNKDHRIRQKALGISSSSGYTDVESILLSPGTKTTLRYDPHKLPVVWYKLVDDLVAYNEATFNQLVSQLGSAAMASVGTGVNELVPLGANGKFPASVIPSTSSTAKNTYEKIYYTPCGGARRIRYRDQIDEYYKTDYYYSTLSTEGIGNFKPPEHTIGAPSFSSHLNGTTSQQRGYTVVDAKYRPTMVNTKKRTELYDSATDSLISTEDEIIVPDNFEIYVPSQYSSAAGPPPVFAIGFTRYIAKIFPLSPAYALTRSDILDFVMVKESAFLLTKDNKLFVTGVFGVNINYNAIAGHKYTLLPKEISIPAGVTLTKIITPAYEMTSTGSGLGYNSNKYIPEVKNGISTARHGDVLESRSTGYRINGVSIYGGGVYGFDYVHNTLVCVFFLSSDGKLFYYGLDPLGGANFIETLTQVNINGSVVSVDLINGIANKVTSVWATILVNELSGNGVIYDFGKLEDNKIPPLPERASNITSPVIKISSVDVAYFDNRSQYYATGCIVFKYALTDNGELWARAHTDVSGLYLGAVKAHGWVKVHTDPNIVDVKLFTIMNASRQNGTSGSAVAVFFMKDGSVQFAGHNSTGLLSRSDVSLTAVAKSIAPPDKGDLSFQTEGIESIEVTDRNIIIVSKARKLYVSGDVYTFIGEEVPRNDQGIIETSTDFRCILKWEGKGGDTYSILQYERGLNSDYYNSSGTTRTYPYKSPIGGSITRAKYIEIGESYQYGGDARLIGINFANPKESHLNYKIFIN